MGLGMYCPSLSATGETEVDPEGEVMLSDPTAGVSDELAGAAVLGVAWIFL